MPVFDRFGADHKSDAGRVAEGRLDLVIGHRRPRE